MCISCLDRFQSTDYEGLGPSRLWSVYFLFGSISVFYLWSEVQVFYGLCISCLGRFQSTDYERLGPSLLLSVYLLFWSISVYWLWRVRSKSFMVCVSLACIDFNLLTMKSLIWVLLFFLIHVCGYACDHFILCLECVCVWLSSFYLFFLITAQLLSHSWWNKLRMDYSSV